MWVEGFFGFFCNVWVVFVFFIEVCVFWSELLVNIKEIIGYVLYIRKVVDLLELEY